MEPETQGSRQQEPTDEVLWASVKGGSEEAFASFMARHRPVALRVAARICGAEAEDAVQAAFLSAWRGRMAFNEARGSARSWIMAVVRNRSVDIVRSRKRRREELAGDSGFEIEAPGRTEDVVVRDETSRLLRAAMAALPDRQRQVLELGYFAELSHSEIASRLDVPLGTVKGRSRLGLQKLAGAAL